MMKDHRRPHHNTAVSEIIGTVLLLGISVTFFTIVYISVLTVPEAPYTPSANIVCRIDGGVLTIEHCGGKGLDLNTQVLISIEDESPFQISVDDYLDTSAKSDDLWSMGEKIEYSSGELLGKKVEVNIVDPKSNSIVSTGRFVVPDRNFTLKVNIIGNGIVEFDPPLEHSYSYGDTIELNAVADSGWIFLSWSGHLSDNINPQTIFMESDKTINAIFTEECYLLDISILGSGSVNKDPDISCYTFNEDVELTATAEPGWTFDGWSGDLTGDSTPVTIILDNNKTIAATFTEEVYTLTVTITGYGMVEYSPSGPYSYGDMVTLWANASSNSTFDGWSGDLTGDSTPVTITINSTKSVQANFLKVYTLTVYTIGDGTVSTDPTQTIYADGTVVTLNAIPESGWIFDEWSGHLSGSTNPVDLTIDENKTVTATFIEGAFCYDIFVEDFEDGEDWVGWDQSNNGRCQVGDYGRTGSNFEGRLHQNTWVERIIDTSEKNNVTISYFSKTENLLSNHRVYFEISYDGLAGPWHEVSSANNNYDWTQSSYDLSSMFPELNNNPNFAIRFRINAANGRYFFLDDIMINACEIQIILDEDFSSNPTDWSITHTSGTAWSWSSANKRMQNSYGYPNAGYLDSPVLDCSGKFGLSLSFWHYWEADYYSGSQDGFVRGSVDGGVTWPYVIDEFHHNDPAEETAVKLYDISSWADGQSQVVIRFDVYNYNDWYWYVDDVLITAE